MENYNRVRSVNKVIIFSWEVNYVVLRDLLIENVDTT